MTVGPTDAERVPSAVLHHLGAAGLTGGERVHRVDDFASYERILRLLQAVLGAIAGISLVTGGIGLMNLPLSQIQSRVHEFGVRRAFGASQSHIFAIILWESVILTAVSSLLGTVFSAGVLNAVLHSVPDFSGGVQFLSLIHRDRVPALRAARPDIIRVVTGAVCALSVVALSATPSSARLTVERSPASCTTATGRTTAPSGAPPTR